MTKELAHLPVLLREVLESMAVCPEGIYLDCTFGRGGHAAAILDRLGPEGRLYAIDKDPEAVQAGMDRFGLDARFRIQRGTFAMLGQLAQEQGIAGRISGVLLDLGVSSPQLDDPARGFSFLKDGPLDMRMDPEQGLSAAQWLAQAGEAEIAQVLFEYGEERVARHVGVLFVRVEPGQGEVGLVVDGLGRVIGRAEKIGELVGLGTEITHPVLCGQGCDMHQNTAGSSSEHRQISYSRVSIYDFRLRRSEYAPRSRDQS